MIVGQIAMLPRWPASTYHLYALRPADWYIYFNPL